MIDFQKLAIIFKREYLTRIRGKAFILTTILIPLGFLLMILIPVGVQMLKSDTEYHIGIVDKTNSVYPRLHEMNASRYLDMSTENVDQLRQQVMDEDIEGYIVIKESNITSNDNPELIYSGSGGINLVQDIQGDLRTAIRDERLKRADISGDVMKIIKNRPELVTRKLTKEGKEESANTTFTFIFGYMMAFIIYGAMFGYGGLVMRGVIEEKTNRIIEVITSSVKPFELLLGKVSGIGALGLTQFIIWIAASIAILTAAAPIAAMVASPDAAAAGGAGASAMPEIPSISPMTWIYFVVFFLLGYLIYSSMFAAIGSAVDSETDTQQLTFPILIPVIIAMVLIPNVASDPDSTLSVVASIIPFFSPILMVARIPITDVPFWQIGLSMVLMLATFIGVMWLTAKIYRVGILMYGKKASFKEIARWIRY